MSDKVSLVSRTNGLEFTLETRRDVNPIIEVATDQGRVGVNANGQPEAAESIRQSFGQVEVADSRRETLRLKKSEG